ncbi:MAG: histidine phosphatase family protein [Proteobacteria bacterium]|nr:histidine phosphatase family protein [Pseudomonadota bacterium]
MTRICLIRHFETDWNRQGRIQGRTDQPLCADAADTVAGKRVRAEFTDRVWFCSPLARAIQTAHLLGAAAAHHEPRLIEMDWGTWEGKRLADLRSAYGDEMAHNESRGLDFRPVGGESPRDVRDRIKAWMLEMAGQNVVGVTHKGVIRAALSLALDWDMTTKPPFRPDWTCAQVFTVSDKQAVGLVQANEPYLKHERTIG